MILQSILISPTLETIPTIEAKLSSCKRRRRNVTFHESVNERTATTSDHRGSVDPSSLWYNAEDYARFQWESIEQATRIQADGCDDPNSWVNSMMRVYFAFRLAQTHHEINFVLESASASIAATTTATGQDTMGLESRCLVPIASDYRVRRQHLLQQMFRIQALAIPKHDKEALLYETSLLSSHAARMYAHFIATIYTPATGV